MYYRTVCPLRVKSLFSVLKALYLLILAEWVVSITCGRDGRRCPILASDPARAALSAVEGTLVLGDAHLALDMAPLCSG